MLSSLFSNPIDTILSFLLTVPSLQLALCAHEAAHGLAAYLCGDPTAKMMGRVTLNPARHLDPMGTLCMLLFRFGWAKPVPVNPRNFRSYRRDDFLVSIAGVSVNLTIFMIAVLLSCVLNRVMMGQELIATLMEAYDVGVEPFVSPLYNVGGAIMDGDWMTLAEFFPYAYGGDLHSGIYIKEGWEALSSLLQHPWLLYVQRALLLLAQVNLTLAVFNLLPIPPLDGFHVVNDILLKGRLQLNHQLYQIARIALFVLLLSGILNKMLAFCVTNVYESVLRAFLALTGQM